MKLLFQHKGLLTGAGLALVALLAWFGVRQADLYAAVDFNRDVRPILNKKCVGCHGGIRRQGDLSLLFREDALKPAKSGRRAIVPGDPGASELLRRVSHADPKERMPKEAPPLTDAEVRILRRWIVQGAVWEDHWAYVKPVAAPLPAVSNTIWPQNALDYFILARLEAEGLQPSPAADCPVLLRRASLDLIGLPPAPEAVDAACQNPTPAAYATFVDTLLASSRFGERWAAMWLDLARYADSQGYEKDASRTIWRYRDWVIRAFNDDLPFDQFTREQLAGDLLPGATEEQRIATAFHRNTMTNAEGGTDDEEHRSAALIDRVNTTWVIWQGTSFACTQCHGHPYDPFRHEDYYRAFAYFNNTEDWDQDDEFPTLASFEPGAGAAGQRLLDRYHHLQATLDSLASTPELTEARRAWEGRLKDPAALKWVAETWQNELLRIARTPEADRDGAQHARIRYIFAEVSDDPRLIHLRQQRAKARQALNALKPIFTPVMQELPPERRRRTYVFERGNFLLRTQEVQPAPPTAITPHLDGLPPNRLGLAAWLTHPDNPLTARVVVNRFWEQLFGIGLVETVEDFGTQGTPPSHPELLDWLAVQFVEAHQWRVKALLRQIVLSATYQQASTVTEALRARDPQNRLLARGPRFRLSAEQIRDQALFVAGLLSDKLYGPSVMPPQPDSLWQSPYSGERWVTATNEDRYRRGLYTFWKRTTPYPALATFDSPSREFCVARRTRTNTPLQALVTLNDPAFVEAAQALAERMLAETAALPDAARVDACLDRGYRLVLQRPPDAPTLATLRTLYQQAFDHYQAHPDDARALSGRTVRGPTPAALTVVANALLNLDAFLTKE
jgi:hypothetical protein